MKTKYISIIILLTFPIILFGQSKIEALTHIPPTKVKAYNIDDLKDNQLLVKMDYATAQIINKDEVTEILSDKILTRVALIYTDFARSNSFSQPKLNKDRFSALFDINPELFNDTLIQWQVFAQTKAKSVKKGKQLFHGFVITYETTSTSYLSGLINTEELPDSTVLNVFERNKVWKDMLIVADLTGSMAPYTAQVLVWLRLDMKNNRAKHFTFFNDGDLKLDDEKEIGSTGGIYHSEGTRFDDILDLARETMINGLGGDAAENDIEAILEGLDSCSNCGDIVLIADNLAPVKDYELLEKVNKPVKVIVCGYSGIINPQYLNIARKTKGSVHTIEEDITNLMEINEGEIITIDKYQYIIRNGEFKTVGKL